MRPKLLFALFLAPFLTLIPFLLQSTVIQKNDLNGNIVPLLYFKDSVLQNLTFAMWNPYINQGIPATADPLYGIFNPIIGIPILLFPYELAIKIMYIAAIILGGFSMYYLVKLFKIQSSFAFIVAVTYMSGSYLSARIVAGHLEKVISYGFLPLFIYCVFRVIREKSLFWAGALSLTLSAVLFSGDIYNTMYGLYLLSAVFIFYLFRQKKVSMLIFSSIVLFFLFSSVKLFPMIELQMHISKIKEPFAGSQNLFSIFYNIFLPIDFLIEKFPQLFTLLPNNFGWWESITFIGPLSLLGFLSLKKIKKLHKEETLLLITLSLLCLFLSMPAADFNPFKYLIQNISLLQFFHVPSRIFVFWSIIILILFARYVSNFKSKTIALVILTVNLLTVVIYSNYILTSKQFPEIKSGYEEVFKSIHQHNPDQKFVVHDSSQGDIPQDTAYLTKTMLLQSNYGLFLKNSPGERFNFRGNNRYQDIQPGFVLYNENESSKNFSGQILMKKGQLTTMSVASGSSLATLGNKPITAILATNRIYLHASSSSPERLVVLQSNYPGWRAFIDGEETSLHKSRFLEIDTAPGQHVYEFRFFSRSFGWGLLITMLSFALFLIANKKIKI